jgi:hypothetical protein
MLTTPTPLTPLQTWAILTTALFDRDVVLMGGSSEVDSWRPTAEERADKFFVQLNHHLFRRERNQPCDWLIARKGSGMNAESFMSLETATRARIKFVSAQLNEPETFLLWLTRGVYIFPFYEKSFNKINPYHPTLEWCNQFWNELRTNPFIGILALKMILMFPVRSVELKGFDFFARGSVLQKNISCHNVRLQVEWLTRMYHTDFRIKLDPNLLKLLLIKERGQTQTYDRNA